MMDEETWQMIVAALRVVGDFKYGIVNPVGDDFNKVLEWLYINKYLTRDIVWCITEKGLQQLKDEDEMSKNKEMYNKSHG